MICENLIADYLLYTIQVIRLSVNLNNLQPIRNLYLSSQGLGNFNTVDLKGNRSIIKKTPVTAPWNNMIFDNVVYDDYLSCERQTLKAMSFRLTDTHGHTAIKWLLYQLFNNI